ncbi:MAG: hypothetical protein RR376_26000, partial [Janthinobacterium sp.]
AVALDLKITSSPETTGAGAGGTAAVQEQGFRGMQLPETIVGTPGASAPAAPSLAAAVSGVAP